MKKSLDTLWFLFSEVGAYMRRQRAYRKHRMMKIRGEFPLVSKPVFNNSSSYKNPVSNFVKKINKELSGEKVETPYLGPNGNWWIGDSDTGVLLSGGGSEIVSFSGQEKPMVPSFIKSQKEHLNRMRNHNRYKEKDFVDLCTKMIHNDFFPDLKAIDDHMKLMIDTMRLDGFFQGNNSLYERVNNRYEDLTLVRGEMTEKQNNLLLNKSKQDSITVTADCFLHFQKPSAFMSIKF